VEDGRNVACAMWACVPRERQAIVGFPPDPGRDLYRDRDFSHKS
jgi:hypothetical protein